MRVTRFMSEVEWEVFQAGGKLINATNHYRDGKGGSISVGFCFTEDSPEDAWRYLAGIVDADVCAVFDFPDGYLRKSTGVYADVAETALFDDVGLRVEWCTTQYDNTIAKVVHVINPFQGAEYRQLKKEIDKLHEMFGL